MTTLNLFLTEEALAKLIDELLELQKTGEPEVDRVWIDTFLGRIGILKQK